MDGCGCGCTFTLLFWLAALISWLLHPAVFLTIITLMFITWVRNRVRTRREEEERIAKIRRTTVFSIRTDRLVAYPASSTVLYAHNCEDVWEDGMFAKYLRDAEISIADLDIFKIIYAFDDGNYCNLSAVAKYILTNLEDIPQLDRTCLRQERLDNGNGYRLFLTYDPSESLDYSENHSNGIIYETSEDMTTHDQDDDFDEYLQQ